MRPWFDEREAGALDAYVRGGGFATEFRRTAELERALVAELSGAGADGGAEPPSASPRPSGRVADVVMTTSGTAALQLAFAAVGVGEGTEVIVPDLTMVATANAARALGARVILIDVDPDLLTITAELVAPHLSDKTRAVAFVALNNRATPAQLAELTALCRDRRVPLVVDAAQALGARVGGVALGAYGDIATLSFSSPKIISTGQGGAVIIPERARACDGEGACDDGGAAAGDPSANATHLAAAVRVLKNFGAARRGADEYVEARGLNLKFTDLQAVVGLEQMKKLPARVARMRAMWFAYRRGLDGVDGLTMLGAPESDPGWIPWFVDVRVDDGMEAREDLALFLKQPAWAALDVSAPLAPAGPQRPRGRGGAARSRGGAARRETACRPCPPRRATTRLGGRVGLRPHSLMGDGAPTAGCVDRAATGGKPSPRSPRPR